MFFAAECGKKHIESWEIYWYTFVYHMRNHITNALLFAFSSSLYRLLFYSLLHCVSRKVIFYPSPKTQCTSWSKLCYQPLVRLYLFSYACCVRTIALSQKLNCSVSSIAFQLFFFFALGLVKLLMNTRTRTAQSVAAVKTRTRKTSNKNNNNN